MLIDILTIFPELFYGVLSSSITARATQSGLLKINPINIREYAGDRHRSVDDTPYGGGPGMIIKPEPLVRAIENLTGKNKPDMPHGYTEKIIYLSPHGKVFNNDKAKELAGYSKLIFICGHYEGIDDRVRQLYVDEEISIGDFVLTGGELPTLLIIDALMRFIPGVLGNDESAHQESFSDGLLEFRQYTKPRTFRGKEVPKALISGNHKMIEEWKLKDSLKETLARRPELIDEDKISKQGKKMLEELKKQNKEK